MKREWIAAALVAAATLATTPVLAASPQCEVIGRNEPWRVRESLMSFADNVFGKPAIEWQPQDFDKIIGIAASCHGYSSGPFSVLANEWRNQINQARAAVVPVSDAARIAKHEVAKIKVQDISLPPCDKLLSWQKDPAAFTDSSKAIFGKNFLLMNDQDVQSSIDFATACVSYLPAFAKGKYGISPQATERLVQSMIDTAYQTAKRRSEAKPPKPTDVQVTINGMSVPSTLAGTRTRKLVDKYNAVAARGTIATDVISDLSREADAILSDTKSKVDAEFAQAVKQRLRQEIFGSSR